MLSKLRFRHPAFALAIGLVIVLTRNGDSIEDGSDVIEAMHETYADSWYEYLTFEQKTTFYQNGEESQVQIWHEALHLPGRLHIKFGDPAEGNGMLFSADSHFVFQNHQLVNRQAFAHPLLILGFDVYRQSPETTIQQLENQDIDLSVMHEMSWQGRPVYVVGARHGDTASNQFWVDKERLVFVRLLGAGPSGAVQDTRFNEYERLGGGWIAPIVEFRTNGVMTMHEAYSDIETPDNLEDALFEPETFLSTNW